MDPKSPVRREDGIECAPDGQHQPGSSPPVPGSFPSGQYPPGPRVPGSPGSSSPMLPRPPTSSYGQWGSGGPGDYPPRSDATEPYPDGSRLRLFLIIVGVVLLVSAAVVVGVVISRRVSQPSSTTSPTASFQQKLPSSGGDSKSVVVVPMRSGGGGGGQTGPCTWSIRRPRSDEPSCQHHRRRFESDHAGGHKNTIIYANAKVPRDGHRRLWGPQTLPNRDPADCARVEHTSWSLRTPICY